MVWRQVAGYGLLIDKPDLKSAINRWRLQTALAGLEGQYSLHSLRYAWAQDAMRYYRQQGFSNREASALVSMDLGQGMGEGGMYNGFIGKHRWVSLNKLESTYPYSVWRFC